MSPEELQYRLADKEDNFVERKSPGVSVGEIRQTASAFANQLTTNEIGILFIGIGDAGEYRGVENTDKQQKRVRVACQQDCYPPIAYTAHVLEHEGVSLVAVVIPPSDNKPHFTGPAYVRVGSESVKANQDQFAQLIASQNEKCGRIQQLGRSTLTVTSHKRLGDSRRVADSAYVEHRECTVAEVDAFHIRLFDIGRSEYYSEPLDNIDIVRDEKKHRPRLIVRQR